MDHNAWSENISAFDELCWCTPQQLLPHYRAAASRARRLQAETTARRVRQHLLEMIEQWERLAGKIEGTQVNTVNEADAAEEAHRFSCD